jgi:alanyl-tRNA synthetase
VGPDYCRFDFNNYNALTDQEILTIEDLVNKYIQEGHSVRTSVLDINEAKKLGATALFDDKYGDKVRVVDMEVSMEFCAGTHVYNTAEIEKFAINSIESIGSGLFRITASTSANAMEFVYQTAANLNSNLTTLVNKMNDLVLEAKANGIELNPNYETRSIEVFGYRYILALRKEIQAASSALKDLEKEYNAKKSQSALSDLDKYDSEIFNNKLAVKVDTTDSNLLKDMAQALKNNKGLDVVMLAGADENKVTFVCAAKDGYDACQLVREATKITGGGGGGKKDLAQAGGKDPSKTLEALEYIKGIL